MKAKVLQFPGVEYALQDTMSALQPEAIKAVLLPTEDAHAYEEHIRRFVEEYQPVGEEESRLVRSLADTQWGLDRIPGLESGLFALGRRKYAGLFLNQTDPHVRAGMLDAHTMTEDAKTFKSLHQQESRLRRQYRQDRNELRKRQAERKQR